MKKLLLVGILLLFGCTLQHGTSRDVVQGYDKGILWSHMYLKNDHSTCYCFNNQEFIKTFDESQLTQKEVIVTYEKYIVKGSLCNCDDKYEKVIVTNVKFAGNMTNEYNI